MITKQKQTGMTAIAWLGVIALILMFVLLALKLLPIYLDSFEVGSVLSDIKNEPNVANMTPLMITRTIMKRLDINMVDDVSKDDIYFDNVGKKRTVEIDYEVRKNLMGNVDLVVHFQKTVTIPTPEP
ncbi:MAG TPA: DUF4845 domain-containing protein [Gammaproteobacteria bacterium]|nr:DUF4845 domain-containing protein [Gammaproteobacteria bacterium]